MASTRRAKREAKQIFRLCQVHELLDENRVLQVTQQIVTADYRDCPAILTHFLRLVRLHRAQHTDDIESATSAPADMQAAVEAGLRRRYGTALITGFVHRPSLIGGMRIRVGWDVYDGSVLAGLEALEKSF
jgi:F-type H+-transporting ATPase subunit delta